MQAKKPINDEKILISVVIPAFNEEKNIISCIAALKKQNFPKQNFEIIMVNNASSDKTGELASQRGAKVVLEPQKGITLALKKGFKISRGQIIAVTDADTIVPEDWLEKIYKTFQKNRSLVTLSGRIILKPKGLLIWPAQLIMSVCHLLSNSGFGCNFVFRKEIYLKIKLGNSDFGWEIDFNQRAKKYGHFIFLWHNPVVTSSRHLQGWGGVRYSSKASLNFLAILLFKKTLFSRIDDVRN